MTLPWSKRFLVHIIRKGSNSCQLGYDYEQLQISCFLQHNGKLARYQVCRNI